MVAPNRKSILEAAMQLSPEERELLADELWMSLDSKENREIEQAWEREAERRLDAYDRGETQAIDGDEVMRALEEGRMP